MNLDSPPRMKIKQRRTILVRLILFSEESLPWVGFLRFLPTRCPHGGTDFMGPSLLIGAKKAASPRGEAARECSKKRKGYYIPIPLIPPMPPGIGVDLSSSGSSETIASVVSI